MGLVNPRRACAGGLRYLSCVSICLSVTTLAVTLFIVINARSKVRGGLL